MAAERLIGVDFGTSTSVIRVKRYVDGKPADERLAAKPVVFNLGSMMVPTLIRETKADTLYGYDAAVEKRASTLHQSFKVLLESSDPEQKRAARELTAEYLKYLAKTYREQRVHLGEESDLEKTIISYPVKWSQDTKDFMLDATRQAGFVNVTGMDEAIAAITAVTLQNEEALKEKKYLKGEEPVNILLLDMGAGTSDLVLCRYTPGTESKTEILCTYPKTGSVLFGGGEVDVLLRSYIAQTVPNEHREKIVQKIGVEKYKAWKETVVSYAMKNNEPVEEFSALDVFADANGFDAEIRLDRKAFEDLCGDYLKGLPELINGCLEEAGVEGGDVDLVILTGGHSQWYFVREIIAGITRKFGSCGLTKIEKDRDRIVSIARPQETVSLGLVFSRMRTVVLEKPDLTESTSDSIRTVPTDDSSQSNSEADDEFDKYKDVELPNDDESNATREESLSLCLKQLNEDLKAFSLIYNRDDLAADRRQAWAKIRPFLSYYPDLRITDILYFRAGRGIDLVWSTDWAVTKDHVYYIQYENHWFQEPSLREKQTFPISQIRFSVKRSTQKDEIRLIDKNTGSTVGDFTAAPSNVKRSLSEIQKDFDDLSTLLSK